MNARMIGGSGFYYPQGLAADGNGNVYGAQWSTRGIKKILDSTGNADPSWAVSGTYRGSGQCRAYYVYSMEVHGTIFMQYLITDTVYLEFIQQLVFVITQSELDMLTI